MLTCRPLPNPAYLSIPTNPATLVDVHRHDTEYMTISSNTGDFSFVALPVIFPCFPGIPAELYYVRSGVLNKQALSFSLPVRDGIDQLYFTWQNVNDSSKVGIFEHGADPRLNPGVGNFLWLKNVYLMIKKLV